MRIGIIGMGLHLPSQARGNGHWPAAGVDGWRAKRSAKINEVTEIPKDTAPGVRAALEAIAALRDDPFQGARVRHVIPDEQLSSDLEVTAAQAAMDDAGVKPSDIDLLLGYTTTHDRLAVPNAYVVHNRLGLPPSCLTLGIEGACNTFLVQLGVARRMIESGEAKRALLIQCSCLSRITPIEQPFSAWFGDAATAQVVGPVADDAGVLAMTHETDSTLHRAVGATVRGGQWYDDGPVELQFADPATVRQMVITAPDRGRVLIDGLLDGAGVAASDVQFYAGHPATAWFVEVSKRHFGFDTAGTIDSFPWAGNLGACNIPTVLATGRQEGLLRDGMLVATLGGGAGGTWSAGLIRWGGV